MEWRKQKRHSISKIQKINIEKFIEKLKSKGKYKPQETVSIIRKQRWSSNMVVSDEDKIEDKIDNNSCQACIIDDTQKNEDFVENIPEIISENLENEIVDNNFDEKVEYYEVEIELPENIDKLKELARLKKQNPDKKEIEFDWKIYLM